MRFFDREYELAEARELEKSGSRMLVIYGKRRVGKTALIKELFKGVNAKKLYFFVPKNENIGSVISTYEEQVREELGLKEYEKIGSMNDLIKVLFEYSKKGKIIAAFDEFQNFSYIYPEAVDLLQREWDMQHDTANLSIAISGSVIGMIKGIFLEKGSPLFKRAYNMVELKELSLEKAFELMSQLKIERFEDKMNFYLLFGGVIFYYSLIDYYGIRTFKEAIKKLFLSPVASLKDTVKSDMIEAFGNGAATYFSILEGIAMGKNTNNEVAAYAGLKETSLPKYIDDLKSLLGVVDTVGLPTREFKRGSKRNALAITDSFYSFWFYAISRNYSYYEIGDMEGLAKKLDEALPRHSGLAFEKFAHKFIEFLSKEGTIFRVDRVGNWHGKDPEKPKGSNMEEIDAVAVGSNSKDILFAECKWQNVPVGMDVYEELKRKAKLVQWHNADRNEHFALFGRSGFTKALIEQAKKEGAMLFDLEAIEKGLK
jgi:hypothetical protein